MSLANWVQVATATVGTGPAALGAASSADLITFAQAGFVVGDDAKYDILDGNNRERGWGIITAGTPWTITRNPIETLVAGTYTGPTASPTPISLSGSAVIGINAGADEISGDIGRTVLLSSSYGDCPDSWIIPTNNGSSLTASSTPGSMIIIPGVFRYQRKFSKFGFSVQTLDAAAANTRLSIYEYNPNSLLLNLLIDSGDISSTFTTTGAKSVAIGATHVLNPGLFYFVLTSQSNTAQVMAGPQGGQMLTDTFDGFSLFGKTAFANTSTPLSPTMAMPLTIDLSACSLFANYLPIFGVLP